MLYFNNQDSKWSRLPLVPSAELIRKFHHQNPSMHFFFSFLWSLMKISNVVFHWVWKELAPLVVTCPGSISDLVLPSPPGPWSLLLLLFIPIQSPAFPLPQNPVFLQSQAQLSFISPLLHFSIIFHSPTPSHIHFLK